MPFQRGVHLEDTCKCCSKYNIHTYLLLTWCWWLCRQCQTAESCPAQTHCTQNHQTDLPPSSCTAHWAPYSETTQVQWQFFRVGQEDLHWQSGACWDSIRPIKPVWYTTQLLYWYAYSCTLHTQTWKLLVYRTLILTHLNTCTRNHIHTDVHTGTRCHK